MSSKIGARAGLKRYQVSQPILKTDHSREEEASDINKVFHSLLQKKRKKVGKLLGHVSHYHELTSRGKRLEIYDFVMHRTRFYWNIKRKSKIHVLILGGGSCNFQPCFRGGSVIFVPKGGGWPCIFHQLHFQMLRTTPPPLSIPVDKSLMTYELLKETP